MTKYLISSSARDINATAYDTPLWVEDDGHAWIAYVDYDLNVMLADGFLDSPPSPVSPPLPQWNYLLIDRNNLDDAHNAPCVGVDPLGYIHVVWNLHNGNLNYGRSTQLRVSSSIIPLSMEGAPCASVTYPRFHRTESNFYFFARNGSSGNGDIFIKRFNLTSLQWEDFACPLISGSSLNPPDNAYLGSIYTEPNGNIHLIWTCRIEWWNTGLFYVCFNAANSQWQKADGTPYDLPITRLTADPIVPISSPSDQSISNSGHAVSVSTDGTIHVCYHRYPCGYREVFHARYDPLASMWIETQVSDLRLPRLDACPGGPTDSRPRPCHMELQGPTLITHSSGSITILYTRSTSLSRGVWARPGGITYRSDSIDSGLTWRTCELSVPVNEFGSEFARESTGKPYVLWQEAETRGREARGALYVVKVDEPLKPITTRDAGLYTSLSIVAKVQPSHGPLSIMPIVDKGGIAGWREFRLSLYGANLGLGQGFISYSDRVQVLLGNSTGNWGLIWYPQVVVSQGLISYLALTWNGWVVSLYLNGKEVDQIPYQGEILASSSDILTGGYRNALGIEDPNNHFRGNISVDIYPQALSPEHVLSLFENREV